MHFIIDNKLSKGMYIISKKWPKSKGRIYLHNLPYNNIDTIKLISLSHHYFFLYMILI